MHWNAQRRGKILTNEFHVIYTTLAQYITKSVFLLQKRWIKITSEKNKQLSQDFSSFLIFWKLLPLVCSMMSLEILHSLSLLFILILFSGFPQWYCDLLSSMGGNFFYLKIKTQWASCSPPQKTLLILFAVQAAINIMKEAHDSQVMQNSYTEIYFVFRERSILNSQVC